MTYIMTQIQIEQSLAKWAIALEISESTLGKWTYAMELKAPFDNSKMITALSYGKGKAENASGATKNNADINIQKNREGIDMAVDNSAYEKGKAKKATVPKKPSQPDAINIDFSGDYAVGQGLADRRLQAVNAGYRDRMTENQEFLRTAFFTAADTLQIGTTYTRSLPSVEAREATNNSLMAMLYGTEEITQDEG